jgi:hypothetical protein
MANQPIVFDNPWQPDAAPAIAPAQVMASMPPDAGQAPALMKIAMGGAPPVFAAPPMPEVSRTPSAIEQQEGVASQRLQDLQKHDTYDFSQHGKLRNAGHVASKIGNVLGDIFAPSTMALIPGTDLNRRVEEGSLGNRLQALAAEQSENEARDATTGKTNAETGEAPQKASDAHNESSALTDEANAKAAALNDQQPTLAQGYSHAVQQAIKEGRDPSTDPVVQHLSSAIVALQPGQNKPDEAPKTIQIEEGGRPHQMGWNPQTNKYDLDMGESGEKPAVVNVNSGKANDRAEKNDVLKAYQPALDSAERMNVMTENYEKAIKDHDQQAMLSLLANHLGMTMGLQKGARMTKDIIREAQESQPWMQGIAAKFDKDGYLSGVTLSPNQMRQMVGLGQSRYAEDAKKSRSTAQYLGATDDGPERVPGEATIRYYTGLANGDAAKAKQLAAADGWTVK